MDDGTFTSVVLGSDGALRPGVASVARDVLTGSTRLLTFFGVERAFNALTEAVPGHHDALAMAILDGYDVGIDFLADAGYRVPLTSFEVPSGVDDRADRIAALWAEASAKKRLVRSTAGGRRSVWVPSASAVDPGGAPFRTIGDCAVQAQECPPDQSWMSGTPPGVRDHLGALVEA